MQNEGPYGDRLADDDLAAAKATDAQLRRIIDTIPVLAWCNLPDGSNEFLNQRWQDYTGPPTRPRSSRVRRSPPTGARPPSSPDYS